MSLITSEEKWAFEQEMNAMREYQRKIREKIEKEERKMLKELHHMRCPKCGMELREIKFKGVNIDKCFSCEGAWFDAGEIETMLALEKTTLDSILGLFKKSQ